MAGLDDDDDEIIIIGNDRKSLRTFPPARYRVFWNYSPRQIPRQIPEPICLNENREDLKIWLK